MRWLAHELLKNTLKMLATFAGIFLLLWWAWTQWVQSREVHATREEYALEVFAGLAEVDEVLASREFHAPGAEAWDCTYAIVALADTAPKLPPTSPDGANWWLHFGGDWQPTPEPPLHDTTRAALAFCAHYFPVDVAAQLRIALTTQGSWYARGPVGENLYIFSPKHRIAAKIRFGD